MYRVKPQKKPQTNINPLIMKREQMNAEPTFKFTWPHKMWPNGEGQYSGTDKKYIQWQRNEFKKLGYKVSKVVEIEHNKHKRDK